MFQIDKIECFNQGQLFIDFSIVLGAMKIVDYGIIQTRWQHAKSVLRILSKTNPKNR